MPEHYNFVHDIKTDQYRKLLGFAVEHCTSFQVVLRNSLESTTSTESVLDRLEPFAISKTDETEWFGTKLLDGTATVCKFVFSAEAAELLGRLALKLYSWKHPELLEDLCLIRRNGEPFLVTISHENDGYLILSLDEKALLDSKIPHMPLQEDKA